MNQQQRDVVQQALTWMDEIHPGNMTPMAEDAWDKSRTALRQLLEQPVQEPVAWVLEWSFNGEEVGRRLYDDETHCKFDAGSDGGICRPLIYGDTTPPAQPAQGESK
jgi:hypothetical protein